MKVLITGSRDWDDFGAICDHLDAYALSAEAKREELILIHGACWTGADELVNRWLCLREIEQSAAGIREDRHPADWAKFGKRAGYVRNQQMVDQQPDVCLAFIRNDSRGASMTAGLAEKAGVRTIRIPYDLKTEVSHERR